MLKTAKVVGLNSDTDAALALIIPADKAFYAIVCASLEDAFSKVRQTLAEAEATFLSSEESLPNRLSQVATLIEDMLKEAENLQILLSITDKDINGTVLYLLYHRRNLTPDAVLSAPLQALLLRGDKQTNLCNMSSEELVSGLLKEGDRVLLTTQNLIDLFGQQLDNFIKLPIESLEDEVEARLPEAQVYPLAAIIIEEEIKEPEIVGTNATEINKLDDEQVFKKRFSLPFGKIIPQSKRSMAILGVALLIVILVGLGLAFKNKRQETQNASFDQNYQQASSEFSKAQSLQDSDMPSSLQSLSLAKKFIEEALKIRPKDTQALSLKKQIEEAGPGILKTFTVTDFPLWLDLGLIKADLSSEKLALSTGWLLVFDSNKKTAVKINLASKAPQILAGEDKIGDGKLASLNGNVALVFSSDKGVVKIDGNQVSIGVKPDKDWGNITGLYGFGGNIYLLDEASTATRSGQIWKYVPTASGYADKKEYLASGNKTSLSGSRRLQIDSSVWVLKNNDEIVKFTKGESDYFAYSGLDKGVKDPKSFFVSDITDNLYILDSGNGRLLVLDKKGVYKAQYQSDRFNTFSDLVVDEKNKKVYLLDGSKIYQMDLK